MAKNNSKKKEITLMTLLANEATSDSRKLLQKHKIEDAKNHEDLELKLAQLYTNTSDKIALEKELADIHPHKKWILKYSLPKEKLNPPIVVEPLKKESEAQIKEVQKMASCDGTTCGCQSSNACGCSSSANGVTTTSNAQTQNNTMVFLGCVLGIVAIYALTIQLKNRT